MGQASAWQMPEPAADQGVIQRRQAEQALEQQRPQVHDERGAGADQYGAKKEVGWHVRVPGKQNNIQ
ncbi:hypothetical protein MyNCGM70_05660 [Achromobacter xylosoxidans]